MISLYDHIIELRADLRSCYISSPEERAEITAELDQANSAGGNPAAGCGQPCTCARSRTPGPFEKLPIVVVRLRHNETNQRATVTGYVITRRVGGFHLNRAFQQALKQPVLVKSELTIFTRKAIFNGC